MDNPAKELFVRALEVPADDLQQFLDAQCGSNDELLLVVHQLLLQAKQAERDLDEGNNETSPSGIG